MWFAINTEGCLRMPLRFELLLLDLAESGPQGKALQCRAGQWKAAQPEAQKLNNARLGSCSALHWMLSYVDEPDEPSYCACLIPCLERHEFPQNAPSPTLKCCGGVKNHLRLATTGTLRSQLLPKTSRAHLPTSLLESPSFVPNPSLSFLQP